MRFRIALAVSLLVLVSVLFLPLYMTAGWDLVGACVLVYAGIGVVAWALTTVLEFDHVGGYEPGPKTVSQMGPPPKGPGSGARVELLQPPPFDPDPEAIEGESGGCPPYPISDALSLDAPMSPRAPGVSNTEG